MTKIIGISVGTGDPELLTLKAVKALASVDVIAYISNNGNSFARTIASSHIPNTVNFIDIDMPMEKDPSRAIVAYDNGAKQIKNAVENGKTVGVLCEGDALFYGSFMYLFDRLKDICPIDIIPGITSLSAGASASAFPLTSRNEILCVVPAPNDIDAINQHLQSADTIVFMKIGRHFDKVKNAINAMGLMTGTICIIKASCPDQEIHTLETLTDAPYFSIIIVRKNKELY